ncbi:MAG TPA: sulfotransferase domain-containing protein [Rhizomicrobium sp.]|jgi:hypothetical protein|nr:sulfotransferase domain-containing protein [Rhizomicrobium sp.]
MAQIANQSLQAIFSPLNPNGSFQPETLRHLQALGAQRPVVMLCFPPKAAGTYFRTAVYYAVDGQLVRTVHAQGGRDAQLYLPTFIGYFAGGVTPRVMVSHVHMQALPANIAFLEAFNIRPVVMMRSIPDMLASYWDMLETDPEARKDGLNCQIPENFPDLPSQTKANFLVDIMGPWYASFFATWVRYEDEYPDRALILRYSEFKSDPVQTLARALSHSRLPRSPALCRAALDKAWSERDLCRYNKGEEGRGARYFTPDHIARLRRMLGAYTHLELYEDELLSIARPALAQAV